MELTAEAMEQIIRQAVRDEVRSAVIAALNPSLDRAAAAAYLSVSVDYIDLMKRQGRLRPEYVGTKPFYRRTDLDALKTKNPR